MGASPVESTNMKEWFFTLSLTENEHHIVEDMIRRFCEENDIEVKYYRKFKTGHVPMERECKLVGSEKSFALLREYFKSECIIPENYHRKEKLEVT